MIRIMDEDYRWQAEALLALQTAAEVRFLIPFCFGASHPILSPLTR